MNLFNLSIHKMSVLRCQHTNNYKLLCITIKHYNFIFIRLIISLFHVSKTFFMLKLKDKSRLTVFQKCSASGQKRHTQPHIHSTRTNTALSLPSSHTHALTLSCSLTTDSQHYWKVEFNHPFLLSHCNPYIITIHSAFLCNPLNV